MWDPFWFTDPEMAPKFCCCWQNTEGLLSRVSGKLFVMRCSDYPRPVFTLIFAPVHNLCSCQELLWKTLQGEVRETITTGREKTVPLTRAYLLPSRIVSLLSIFRSLHHISKLVLPLAWLQTLHTRNNICFSWSLIPLLHCCKLLKWGTDVSPLLWGVEVSSPVSAKCPSTPKPEGCRSLNTGSAVSHWELVKRGLEKLSCDGADSSCWKEQLGVPSFPSPELFSFMLRLCDATLNLLALGQQKGSKTPGFAAGSSLLLHFLKG